MSFLCWLTLMASQYTNIKFPSLAELWNFIAHHSLLLFTQTQWPFCNALNMPGLLTLENFYCLIGELLHVSVCMAYSFPFFRIVLNIFLDYSLGNTALLLSIFL